MTNEHGGRPSRCIPSTLRRVGCPTRGTFTGGPRCQPQAHLNCSGQWVFTGYGKSTLRSRLNSKVSAKADLSKFNRRLDGNSSPPENPTAESGSLFLHVPVPRTFYCRSPCESVVSIPVIYCLDVKTHRSHQSFFRCGYWALLEVAPLGYRQGRLMEKVLRTKFTTGSSL